LRAVTSAQCGLRATQRRVARFAGLEDFRAVPLAASRILLGANAKEYVAHDAFAISVCVTRARYIFAATWRFDQPGGGDEAERATAHAGAAGRGTESHLDGVSER
jgi:hypothetical protein